MNNMQLFFSINIINEYIDNGNYYFWEASIPNPGSFQLNSQITELYYGQLTAKMDFSSSKNKQEVRFTTELPVVSAIVLL